MKLPDSRKYTLYDRCKEANLRLLSEKFELAPKSTPSYRLVVGDLTTFKNAQLIAHQSDCVSFAPQKLAAVLAEELQANACEGRIADPRNPFLALPYTQSMPGTIRTTWSPTARLLVTHLYAQRESGLPNKREDTNARIDWFKQCLTLVQNYIVEQGLTSIAFPYHIGCGNSGGDWLRYERIIDDWTKKNKDRFEVYVVIQT